MQQLKTSHYLYIILIIFFQIAGCANHPQANIEKGIHYMNIPQHAVSKILPEYRLGYGDVIDVKFFNHNRFNENVIVRPDGRISMEKVGDIHVAGMTPNELSKAITNTYSKIIKNPEVTVIVRNFGGYQVYILGEVKSPGAIPMQRNMTILQVLAEAGGQNETANLKSIMLIRRNEDGTIKANRIDLRSLTPEAMQANDLFVQAFDIIYIPKTFIANVNTFIDQALSGVIKPLDIYMRAVWYYNLR